MAETELLPCPFCGDAPYVIEDDSYNRCHIGCNCEAEPTIFRDKGFLSDCIAAWNRRIPSPSEGDSYKRGIHDALKYGPTVFNIIPSKPRLAIMSARDLGCYDDEWVFGRDIYYMEWVRDWLVLEQESSAATRDGTNPSADLHPSPSEGGGEGWRTIDSAPKVFGKRFIGWSHERGITDTYYEGTYEDNGEPCWMDHYADDAYYPTHWLPMDALPPMPKQVAAVAGEEQVRSEASEPSPSKREEGEEDSSLA